MFSLHIPIPWRNIPSCTNFVTEYCLHLPISWRNILFVYQFRDRIFPFINFVTIFPSCINFVTEYTLHLPISLRNIPFIYQFGDGIFSSSTNFVTEYTLHVPIWWRDILFIYQFRDGILHFVLASYLSFVNIRFYIYICTFLRYICYWYSMRILCHCTYIYNNDECHFVLYILKSTTYTAIFTLHYPSKMFF
jgi:hypothetical protein